LHPACADDDAGCVQLEIGRVEEEDLADLRFERIEAECDYRGAMVGRGNRELELDAVRLARESEHARELVVREPRGGTCGHPQTL
jgi:hypothetical protein